MEDESWWLGIHSENPEGPSAVFCLHGPGAESFSSLFTWPRFENLHRELWGIDFREAHEPLTPFFDAYGPPIDELVSEELRLQEMDELLVSISPLENFVSSLYIVYNR